MRLLLARLTDPTFSATGSDYQPRAALSQTRVSDRRHEGCKLMLLFGKNMSLKYVYGG
jgi:hypothetical protein